MNTTKYLLLPTPYNLTVFKGSKYVALTRKFAEFILKSEVSRTYYNWLMDMEVADESFYSTMKTVVVNQDGTVGQDLNTNMTYGQERKQNISN